MLRRGEPVHWRDDRGAACVAPRALFFRRPLQAAPPTRAPTLRLCVAPRDPQSPQTTPHASHPARKFRNWGLKCLEWLVF